MIRTIIMALCLRRMRHTHPEMFDGAAALASIRACLHERAYDDYMRQVDKTSPSC